MNRTFAALCALLLLVGSVAPAGAVSPTSDATTPSVTESAASSVDADAASSASAAPDDPEEDVIGWENGYWYNESIDVDQTDGLSDAELEATVGRAMARVEHIRQLEFEKTVPVEVMSREEFASDQANQTTSPALNAFDNVKFEALLLIGEQDDSIAVQNENRGSSVLGFYSPARDEIVLIAENSSALRIDELTLAHELVHALQDQHFDFGNARTRDEVNAHQGLTEGDPSYVEYKYSNACDAGEWAGTCVKPPASEGGGGGGVANIGVYFVKYQPYSDGPNFVQHLYRRGGWDAVNAAYDDFPKSAEQVISPAKYGQDEPTKVSLRDGNSSEWTRVKPPGRPNYATVGQSGVAAMFAYTLYDSEGQTRIVTPDTWLNTTSDGSLSSFDPLNYGIDYADGWDGDRMHVYRNADNETAYVWRLVWDDEGNATEFADGYRQVLEYWGAEKVGRSTWVISEGQFADAFHVIVDGDTVTIVNAPSVESLSTVHDTVSVEEETETPPPTDATFTPTPTVIGDTEPSPEGTDRPHTATTATDASTPGFGVVVAVVAFLAVALLARRRP